MNMNQSPFEAEYKKPIDWRAENDKINREERIDWRAEASTPGNKDGNKDKKNPFSFQNKSESQKH